MHPGKQCIGRVRELLFSCNTVQYIIMHAVATIDILWLHIYIYLAQAQAPVLAQALVRVPVLARVLAEELASLEVSWEAFVEEGGQCPQAGQIQPSCCPLQSQWTLFPAMREIVQIAELSSSSRVML